MEITFDAIHSTYNKYTVINSILQKDKTGVIALLDKAIFCREKLCIELFISLSLIKKNKHFQNSYPLQTMHPVLKFAQVFLWKSFH